VSEAVIFIAPQPFGYGRFAPTPEEEGRIVAREILEQFRRDLGLDGVREVREIGGEESRR